MVTGLENLKLGYSKIPEQVTSLRGINRNDSDLIKTEGTKTSIALKILGGGCMASSAAIGVLGAVTAVAFPVGGVIVLTSAVALGLLGYDMAEFGSSLGKLAESRVQQTKAVASRAFENIKEEGVFRGLKKTVNEASDPSTVVKKFTKKDCTKHTLLFGNLFVRFFSDLVKQK